MESETGRVAPRVRPEAVALVQGWTMGVTGLRGWRQRGNARKAEPTGRGGCCGNAGQGECLEWCMQACIYTWPHDSRSVCTLCVHTQKETHQTGLSLVVGLLLTYAPLRHPVAYSSCVVLLSLGSQVHICFSGKGKNQVDVILKLSLDLSLALGLVSGLAPHLALLHPPVLARRPSQAPRPLGSAPGEWSPLPAPMGACTGCTMNGPQVSGPGVCSLGRR